MDNFISRHRQEFDDEYPQKDLWPGIEKVIAKQPVKKMAFFLKVAAAVLIIATAAGAYFLGADKKIAMQANPPDMAYQPSVAQEYPETAGFAKLISEKQAELEAAGKVQPALYQKFRKDMMHLDSSYQYLNRELQTNPDKEAVMQAMIENLQIKLRLLGQQLKIINQIKNAENENDKKSNPVI